MMKRVAGRRRRRLPERCPPAPAAARPDSQLRFGSLQTAGVLHPLLIQPSLKRPWSFVCIFTILFEYCVALWIASAKIFPSQRAPHFAKRPLSGNRYSRSLRDDPTRVFSFSRMFTGFADLCALSRALAKRTNSFRTSCSSISL